MYCNPVKWQLLPEHRVLYMAVSDELNYDKESRINSFAHVNHAYQRTQRIGVFVCINGSGIFNRWIKNMAGGMLNYQQMNEAAAKLNPGAMVYMVLPFGNGAEEC